MCCINSDKPPYRCCCCFPLVLGVILCFLIECLRLYVYVLISDVFEIVITSLVLLMYVISFFQSGNLMVRQGLFYTYAASFALWAINFIIFCATNKIDDVIYALNDGANAALGTSGSDIADDISGMATFLVVLYAILCVTFMGLFTRMLYYYMKELSEKKAQTNDEYTSLPEGGKQAKETEMTGNAMQ